MTDKFVPKAKELLKRNFDIELKHFEANKQAMEDYINKTASLLNKKDIIIEELKLKQQGLKEVLAKEERTYSQLYILQTYKPQYNFNFHLNEEDKVRREQEIECLRSFLDEIKAKINYREIKARKLKESLLPKQDYPKTRILTIPQIALLYIYTDRHIDSSNADDIVKEESEDTCKSGALLIKKYNALSSSIDRVSAGPIMKVKDTTRLKDIKTVIEILEAKGFSSEKAKADYSKLKTNIGNDIE